MFKIFLYNLNGEQTGSVERPTWDAATRYVDSFNRETDTGFAMMAPAEALDAMAGSDDGREPVSFLSPGASHTSE